jgi:hypothetical protein
MENEQSAGNLDYPDSAHPQWGCILEELSKLIRDTSVIEAFVLVLICAL